MIKFKRFEFVSRACFTDLDETRAKRRNKDDAPPIQYPFIKEDSVEFILDSDEAQNNNKKPEPSLTLQYQQQHLGTQKTIDNQPSTSTDLQQQRQVQSQPQPYQRQLQRPPLGVKSSHNTLQLINEQEERPLNRQQPPDSNQPKPQEQQQQHPIHTEQQNQTETQSQYSQKQQQNLKQPLKWQQPQSQNPELFRRNSDWDEIRTPEGRVIPTFQGEPRPPQPKQKEPRLLPQPDFFLSSHREHLDTRRLSHRELVSNNQVLFERVSKRQPSAPQLGQTTAKRHSIIETPRGPQRASQVQYQEMERRLSQMSPKFPHRENVSLPSTPHRCATIRENKTTQNTPLKIPQSDQRRLSQEYQRLNSNLEPSQREAWQQSSTPNFSGTSHVQSRNYASSSHCIPGISHGQLHNYSSSSHCIVTQAPIQNYLAASQCVVGASPSQYYGSSTQSVSNTSHGTSHYHHASLSQSVSGPAPGSSQFHTNSAHSISGPPHGISQYHSNSGQSEAKYRSASIQSGSGYAQNQPQYYASPQSGPAPSRSHQYRTGSSQRVSSLGHGPSHYQDHSSQSISIPTQGQTQPTSKTSQALPHTASGTTQIQSQYKESPKISILDSAQNSIHSTQVPSQCQESSMKCNLNSSQTPTKNVVASSQVVSGAPQNIQNEKFQKVSYPPQRNAAPEFSENNDNSTKCITNASQSITQDNPSSSKGAIPKKGLSQKNNVSNVKKPQSTAASTAASTTASTTASMSASTTASTSASTAASTTASISASTTASMSASTAASTTASMSASTAASTTATMSASMPPISDVAKTTEKSKEDSQNAAGPSKKLEVAPKPSPPKKIVGPSKSPFTPAKSKAAQNAASKGPQQLMSSYSQLVATLSQNKPIPTFESIPLVEVTQVETPKEVEKASGPFAILANTIPNAAAMFAKMRNTILGTNNEKMNSQPLEYNPIMQYFEVQEEVCNAGPGLVWRVHDALRKADARESSVFMFDKRAVDKLYRPKCKELMLDRLKNCIYELDKLRHPRMLEIMHSIEESTYTLAFATERIYASLHNILAWHESCPIDPEGPFPVIPNPHNLGPPTVQPMPTSSTTRPPFAREYHFLDLEIRHGFHQISEALQYMHLTMRTMHRNVCPYNVLVTQRGVWKLFGLEFAEPIPSDDPLDFLSVPQWSCKIARICQPHLDYMAPETQMRGHASTLADMYALGMILAAIFNQGRPLINTNFNPILYVKQMEQLDRNVAALVSRAPDCLHEALPRLLDRDPQNRPTTQLMPLITYFRCANEPPIQALEALDAALHKAPSARCEYYAEQLPATLAYIPEKLRWQNVWPVLQIEFKMSDMIPSVLKPTFWLVNECTQEEFDEVIYPTIRKIIYSQRPIPITVVLLENLHILTKKCTPEVTLNDLIPMLFYSLDCNLYQIQIAALIALQNVSDVIPDDIMYASVVVKVKNLLDKNTGDVKIINLVLGVFEKILPRLDNTSILTYVVPTVLNMRLGDPNVINRIVRLYRAIITDEKFDLTSDIMATEMIPKLAPQSVNPNLNVDQFNNLIEILYDMLENIERCQRQRLKAEGASAAGSNRRMIRHQKSNENVPAPPFNIPNLRVEQRKTSSADNMARRNSAATVSQPASVSGSVSALRSRLGQWFFGSNNSTNNDGNFLRVTSILPNRRLSDNTLMTPKIRIAPSCASSPGGTPGGTAGLPSRRHSSIGPQERRLSTANLSPPTHARHPRGRGSGSSLSVPSTSRVGGGSMPNTSSSVPFLATVTCRRPSGQGSQGGSQRGSQGSGILSHMVRLFPNNSATSSPRRTSNRWFQGSTNSAYNSIRHSTNALTRKFPSLNVFVSGLQS